MFVFTSMRFPVILHSCPPYSAVIGFAAVFTAIKSGRIMMYAPMLTRVFSPSERVSAVFTPPVYIPSDTV